MHVFIFQLVSILATHLSQRFRCNRLKDDSQCMSDYLDEKKINFHMSFAKLITFACGIQKFSNLGVDMVTTGVRSPFACVTLVRLHCGVLSKSLLISGDCCFAIFGCICTCKIDLCISKNDRSTYYRFNNNSEWQNHNES